MLPNAGNYLLQIIRDILCLVLCNSAYLIGYPSYEFGPRFLITTIVCVKIFVTGIHQCLFEGFFDPTSIWSHVGGDEDGRKITKSLTYNICPRFVWRIQPPSVQSSTFQNKLSSSSEGDYNPTMSTLSAYRRTMESTKYWASCPVRDVGLHLH